MNRKEFVRTAAAGMLSAAVFPSFSMQNSMAGEKLFFKISLAEWSLNRTLFSGEIDNFDFPALARKKFGIEAVEYVNQFFPSSSERYARELLKRSEDAGVKNLLIMIDGEGELGDLYSPRRQRAVEKHIEWIDCAKILGCHSIRVNAAGTGSADEVARAAAESLRSLCEYAKGLDLNVIVENHGGYSSDGQWLKGVISSVEMDNCGTLPDFGNFRISQNNEYDRYKGMEELLPFARGVSAKSHDFDKEGKEIHTDYEKMLRIVRNSGFEGYIGIEYEGNKLSEEEGIMATKNLLIKTGKKVGS